MGKWLVALAWPAISRILSALGIGTVTFLGMEALVNDAITTAQSSMGGIAPDIAALLAMAGFFTALSVTSGAMVASLALLVLKRFSLRSGA